MSGLSPDRRAAWAALRLTPTFQQTADIGQLGDREIADVHTKRNSEFPTVKTAPVRQALAIFLDGPPTLR